jgi:hypothetical protein
MVAVGKSLHFSNTWKTFPDFLSYYLKKKLGALWGRSELEKPFDERHTILQWYDAVVRALAATPKTTDEVASTPMNGVMACYYGLAYGLYLLEHNVELQDRLLARLRLHEQFQGAYYEVLVASVLIRSGFELALEDETDIRVKHCEFAAICKRSGKRYWIEAKMRGVVGVLGRTYADGGSTSKPLSRMIYHLNRALEKPAEDERMIFIDVNTPMGAEVTEAKPPAFMREAYRRLVKYEKDKHESAQRAYIFITNVGYHHDLLGRPNCLAMPFGLGIPEFNRPSTHSLTEQYRRDWVHDDALRVTKGFQKLLILPATFDGSLPSTTLHREAPPVQIGRHYIFERVAQDGGDLAGIVTAATVLEDEKAAIVAVYDGNQAHILKQSLSEAQLAEYAIHKDAYFGEIVPVQRETQTPYGLFQFFMEINKVLSRAELIARLESISD